jgi:hypothetical protein
MERTKDKTETFHHKHKVHIIMGLRDLVKYQRKLKETMDINAFTKSLAYNGETKLLNLRNQSSQQPIEDDIKRRNWNLPEHVLQKATSNITGCTLKWNPQ